MANIAVQLHCSICEIYWAKHVPLQADFLAGWHTICVRQCSSCRYWTRIWIISII